MKKILILMCFCFFTLGGICQTSFAESTKGFSLGIKIGTFPIVSFFNSYHFEVGYQFTNSVSIIGEFAYGEATNSWDFGGHLIQYYDCIYSCIPIRASLLVPLIKAKTFSIYWGGGLGYYLITVKQDITFHDLEADVFGEEPWFESKRTDKINGLAPYVTIGMDLMVLKRIAIFGELKQVFGPEWLREIERYSDPWEKNVHFRRPELIIGIRFYFKD